MPVDTDHVDDRAIRRALAGVIDPCCREREISVLDMGLLESIRVDGDHVTVELVLTSGWCPFQLDLVETVTSAVDAVDGVASTSVDITLDQTWSSARMSDHARSTLRFLPRPGSIDRDQYLATTPGASHTESPTRWKPRPLESNHDR